MKKTLFALSLLTIFSSCSSDDSSDSVPVIDQDLVLNNYVLTYASGNVIKHNFNGSNGVNTTRNDEQTTSFEYNSAGKMSKFIKYESDGEVSESYSFNYDETGVITSIDEFHAFSFILPENFTREVTYDGNSIKTTFPENLNNNYDLEFILNDKGLLQEYIQLDSIGELVTKLVFTYDTNDNCTSVVVTIMDFNDNEVTSTYIYNFDDKKNPVYAHFKENYIPSLFIYGRSFLLDVQLRTLVRTFGKNNITTTVYPEGFPETSQFYFEHDYNASGYPAKSRVKNVSTNALSYEAVFFYD